MNLLRQHNRTATVVALALALSACGKSPEQHLQQAQARLQKADYKAAVIELKTVLEKQPDNRAAHLLLAEVFLRSGAYPDAAQELERARSLGAPDEQVLPSLAKAYLKMGEPQKALGLGVPASGLSPRSLATLHAVRAQAQLALGQRTEAEHSIEAGVRADPKQPELLLTQARLALMDRQRGQAGRLVDEALRQDPTLIEALYLKAALLESGNKSDEAAKAYQQIFTIDPSQYRAQLAIAGLQLKQGDTDAAAAAIQAAEKVAGGAPVVMYARGVLELQRGNLDKASSSLLKVLRVLPDHLPTALAYAMASYRLGDYQQAMSHAGKVLGAAPNSLIAAKILAASQLRSGDIRGAVRTLDTALAIHPSDIRLLALAGDAHLRIGDYDKAMAYLDKAAELEPDNAAIKTRLAAGHQATGDDGEALAALEADAGLSDQSEQTDMTLIVSRLNDRQYDEALKAIADLEKKIPGNPVTHNLRAIAYLGKQDRAAARKSLEQALAIQSGFAPAAINLARLDMAEKKPELARKRLESLLAKDKHNAQAMLAMADLARANRDDKNYLGWLEKAAAADPQALPPRLLQSRYWLAKGDSAKAIAAARSAVAARPDNPAALDLLGLAQAASWAAEGDAALAKKQYPAALAAYEHAYTLAPSPATLVGQHQALAASGRFDEGTKRLADWLAAHPQDRRTRFYLAEQLIAHEQYRAAAEHYLLLNQQAPGNVVVLNNLASALSELSDKRALGFAEQALKLKPDNPAIMDTAGWILVQQGQAERGAKLLQQALSKMPNAAEIRYHLAVAYTKLGDDARAEKELQSVLATNAAFHQRQKAKTLLAQLQAKTR